MTKRLIHTRAVRQAEDMINEVLARRRVIKPGILVRYYEHGRADIHNPNSEVILLTGVDRVAMIHPKEPRIELEFLGRRMFTASCAICPYDAHHRQIEQGLMAKRLAQVAVATA